MPFLPFLSPSALYERNNRSSVSGLTSKLNFFVFTVDFLRNQFSLQNLKDKLILSPLSFPPLFPGTPVPRRRNWPRLLKPRPRRRQAIAGPASVWPSLCLWCPGGKGPPIPLVPGAKNRRFHLAGPSRGPPPSPFRRSSASSGGLVRHHPGFVRSSPGFIPPKSAPVGSYWGGRHRFGRHCVPYDVYLSFIFLIN